MSRLSLITRFLSRNLNALHILALLRERRNLGKQWDRGAKHRCAVRSACFKRIEELHTEIAAQNNAAQVAAENLEAAHNRIAVELKEAGA